MKSKILLTSALALTIASPAMSETLPVIDDCVQSEIGVSEGTASLEADWTANRINITWDNNGATTDATGGASVCTYAETFTLPQAPERTGYNFAGWKVKTSVFDLSTLDTSIGGTVYAYSRLNGKAGSKEATYGLTQGSGEWATDFGDYAIKGMAKCSTKSGNDHSLAWDGDSADWKAEESELTSASGEAEYCWCQVTGYDAEKDGTYMSVNVSSSSWVFNYAHNGEDTCKNFCANTCAGYAQNKIGFRSALFGK